MARKRKNAEALKNSAKAAREESSSSSDSEKYEPQNPQAVFTPEMSFYQGQYEEEAHNEFSARQNQQTLYPTETLEEALAAIGGELHHETPHEARERLRAEARRQDMCHDDYSGQSTREVSPQDYWGSREDITDYGEGASDGYQEPQKKPRKLQNTSQEKPQKPQKKPRKPRKKAPKDQLQKSHPKIIETCELCNERPVTDQYQIIQKGDQDEVVFLLIGRILMNEKTVESAHNHIPRQASSFFCRYHFLDAAVLIMKVIEIKHYDELAERSYVLDNIGRRLLEYPHHFGLAWTAEEFRDKFRRFCKFYNKITGLFRPESINIQLPETGGQPVIILINSDVNIASGGLYQDILEN